VTGPSRRTTGENLRGENVSCPTLNVQRSGLQGRFFCPQIVGRVCFDRGISNKMHPKRTPWDPSPVKCLVPSRAICYLGCLSNHRDYYWTIGINVSLPLIAHVILPDRVGRLILGLAPAKLRGRKVWVARPVHRISCTVSPHSYTSGSCGPLLWLQIACDQGSASAAIALRLVTTTLYVN